MRGAEERETIELIACELHPGMQKNIDISNSNTGRKCKCISNCSKKRCKDVTVFSHQVIQNIGMYLPLHLHLSLFSFSFPSLLYCLSLSLLLLSSLFLSSLFSSDTETDLTSQMIPPGGAGLDVKFTCEDVVWVVVCCCVLLCVAVLLC